MNLLLFTFKLIIYASVLGSVLASMILIFKLFFGNKLGARWQYCLWFLLLIRLLVPYTPQSSISIFNLFHSNQREVIGENYIVTSIKTPFDENLSQNIIQHQANNSEKVKSVSKSKVETENVHYIEKYIRIIAIFWLGGVSVLTIHTFASFIILWSKLKKQSIAKNKNIIKILGECKEKMNIKTKIILLDTDIVKTPAIFGVIRPKLLLPTSMDEMVSNKELEYIILHELSHLKRKDIFVGCIICALQILHWFNPIIWYSFYIMRGDKELACDALALSYIDSSETVEYGKTIVKLLEVYTKPTNIYGMAGIVNNKSQIKRRITMISRFKKNSYRLTAASIVILAAMGGIMLTNAKGNSAQAASNNNENKISKKVSQSINTSNESNALPEASNGNTSVKQELKRIQASRKVFKGIEDVKKNTPYKIKYPTKEVDNLTLTSIDLDIHDYKNKPVHIVNLIYTGNNNAELIIQQVDTSDTRPDALDAKETVTLEDGTKATVYDPSNGIGAIHIIFSKDGKAYDVEGNLGKDKLVKISSSLKAQDR